MTKLTDQQPRDQRAARCAEGKAATSGKNDHYRAEQDAQQHCQRKRGHAHWVETLVLPPGNCLLRRHLDDFPLSIHIGVQPFRDELNEQNLTEQAHRICDAIAYRDARD